MTRKGAVSLKLWLGSAAPFSFFSDEVNLEASLADNGFEQYQKLILHELERLATANDETRERIGVLASEIATLAERINGLGNELNFKSGIWGAVGAAIPVMVGALWLALTR